MQSLCVSMSAPIVPHVQDVFGLQALNEEKCIAETLQIVRSLEPSPHEVIVVDGGSTDRSVNLLNT